MTAFPRKTNVGGLLKVVRKHAFHPIHIGITEQIALPQVSFSFW